MGWFDNITKIVKTIDKVSDGIREMQGKSANAGAQQKVATSQSVKTEEELIISSTSRSVEELDYGDNDSEYKVTYTINDSFKSAMSHAAEILMLNTYAPDAEYGDEGSYPYVAVHVDDSVYGPVEEYKTTGTFKGAQELTPLSGKFYFKAKKEYYNNMMYFYGLDRCDGFWKNNGLCVVYPKSYVGTENEVKLMKVLDEVAASYTEERVK